MGNFAVITPQLIVMIGLGITYSGNTIQSGAQCHYFSLNYRATSRLCRHIVSLKLSEAIVMMFMVMP